ncbi:hypothetical protein SDC9_177761 [bioreactor metagenome]|uniref:Uncharacterized protein n=1 Tax=bioreactor metagenome TaxID=1076179 RepID=A0A645GTY6_9ZZZZ
MHRFVPAHLLIQRLTYSLAVAHPRCCLADPVDFFLLRGEDVLHCLVEADALVPDCSCIQGGLIDMLARLQNEAGDILLGKETAVDHPAGEKKDGIAFTPGSLFLPAAVDAGIAL